VLDFLERERVIGALVPVALTIDGVKRETGLVGLLAPIRPFVAWDALHDVQLPEKNPWPVPPKPPRVAPGVPVGVAEAVLVCSDDPLLDEPHQLREPLRVPDVLRQGCCVTCCGGAPGWAAGTCCTHSFGVVR